MWLTICEQNISRIDKPEITTSLLQTPFCGPIFNFLTKETSQQRPQILGSKGDAQTRLYLSKFLFLFY